MRKPAKKYVYLIIVLIISLLAVTSFTAGCKSKEKPKARPKVSKPGDANQSEPKPDDWLFYGRNLERTRNFPDSKVKPPLKRKWVFSDDKLLIEFSASISGDKLFIGADNFYFYCLNKNTGKLIWKIKTDEAIDSTAAIAGNKVFIGSFDGKMRCLNINDGSAIWIKNIGVPIESSPIVYKNNLFFGASDGYVYALKIDSGSTLWRYKTGDLKVLSAPAIYENKLYIAGYNNYFYTLDTSTGKLIWKTKTNGAMYSSPAISNGIVVVGNKDKNVYAFSADNGKILWKFSTGGEIYSSPAIADNKVFIGSFDNKLYALDLANGHKIWEFNASTLPSHLLSKPKRIGIINSPSIINGVVYSATLNEPIFAVDASTGKLLWKYPDGRYSMAIADNDTLYVAGRNQRFYAFENR